MAKSPQLITIVILLSMCTFINLISSKTYRRNAHSTVKELRKYQTTPNPFLNEKYTNQLLYNQESFDRNNMKIVKKSEVVYYPNTKHINRQEAFDEPLPITNENEEDDELVEYFLEVLGPSLFLVPFVLMAFPLLLPAIPLSVLLNRDEGSGDAKKRQRQRVEENFVNLEKLTEKL